MNRLFEIAFASLLILAFAGVLQASGAPAAGAGSIIAAEYYIDHDPGEGKGASIAPTDGAFDSVTENIQFLLKTSKLSLGPHTAFVRMKAENGTWGIPRKATLEVTGDKHITDMEYYFDTDPGPGSGLPIPPAGDAYYRAVEPFSASIDTSGLSSGPHTVYVRARDSEGNWGVTRGYPFEVREFNIKAAEFFIDSDPGVGKGIPLSAVDGSFNSSIEQMQGAFSTSNLGLGKHSLFARVMTLQSGWGSKSDPVTFTTTSNHAPKITSPPTGPVSADTGQACTFTASATDADGDPISYRFDWGNGDQSDWGAASRKHSWAGSGTFCVKAQARDDKAAESLWSECIHITIADAPPGADFIAKPVSGPPPLIVQFTDKSKNKVTSRSWDFGDGRTSKDKNPSHIYSSPGTYSVALTAAGPGGSDVESKANYITVTEPAPIADFTANPTSGTAPLAVKFADASKNKVTGWVWDFGDGISSLARDPSHTYEAGGTYTVKLTVTGPGGSDTKTIADCIKAGYSAPKADFSASPTSGPAPLAVKFTDSSKGEITKWMWDFGDGQIGKDQHPSHTYSNAGKYTVTLQVTGPGGTDTVTKDGYLTVSAPAVLKASGRVTMVNGNPISGKLIKFSTSEKDATVPASVRTDQDGRWSQEGFQKGVTYGIEPDHDGYSYSPSYRRYKAVDSKSNLDFQAVGFNVSGKASTPALAPIPGVVISFSVVSGKGSTPSSVKTGKDGNWSRMGFDPGTIYKATPIKRGYNFHPATVQFGGPTKRCNFEGALKNK